MTAHPTIPGPRVEVVEPSPELAAAARAYFAAEAAEEAARLAYQASWGTEGEWAAFLRREGTVEASRAAWARLRDAMPDRTIGRYYAADGRLFGWCLVGVRYAFRVRGREDSESIMRRLDGSLTSNHSFAGTKKS